MSRVTQEPAPRPAGKRPAGRRRRVLGWTVHAVLFVALTAAAMVSRAPAFRSSDSAQEKSERTFLTLKPAFSSAG
jgi:hypothetical protein